MRIQAGAWWRVMKQQNSAKQPADTFIDIVQKHERTWGTETYPDRPSLADLLSAPIVAWWRSANAEDDRLKSSIHQDLDELNRYAVRILLHSRLEFPDKRLAMVYINQKKAAIKGVSLHIVPLDDKNNSTH